MEKNRTEWHEPDSRNGKYLRLFAAGILLLLFGASLLSYAPRDAAILCGGIEREPANWIGWGGAFVANLLFLLLGLSSYVLLFLVVLHAVRVVVGVFFPAVPVRYPFRSLWAVLGILLGCTMLFGLAPEMFQDALVSLGLGSEEFPRSGLSGGVIGQFICAPRCGDIAEGILRRFIGTMGTLIVGWGIVIASAIWLYWIEWKDLVKYCFFPDLPKTVPESSVPDERAYRQTEQELFVPQPKEATVPPRPSVPEFSAEAEPENEHTAAVSGKDGSEAFVPETQEEKEEEQPRNNNPDEPVEPERVPQATAVPVSAAAPAPAMRSLDVNTNIVHAGTKQSVTSYSDYVLPPLSMLSQGAETAGENLDEIAKAKEALQHTLEDFGIPGWVSNYTSGPRITRYEITLEPGINVRKVEQISDNIAMNLSAQSVRILAPIPGRPVVGVEVSNSKSSAVFMRSVMESDEWRSGKADIPVALGKDVAGRPVVLDIANAPHMLIAGSTGTGKSVCSNSLIMSLLFHFRPDQLKLIMVDPKVVEFEDYKNLPHLLTPVINDSSKVPIALRWAVNEMEKRYRQLARAGVKKISEYNTRQIPEEPLLDDDGLPIPDRLPVLLIIIDELGDLMMTEAKKDVENSITRIAQKGRAAGVHIVVATQRPSTNVITGVIKANLPTRLCFQVRALVDSRVVLDQSGGEKLLGKGDMLYMSPSSMIIERVQGSFVPDSDIKKVVEFVCGQAPQHFNSAVLAEEEADDDLDEDSGRTRRRDEDDDEDDMPWEDDARSDVSEIVKKYLRPGDEDVMRQALEVVILDRQASTSYLQRRLKIGYNRAADLIDQMEQRGIVGPPSGSGNKRDILVFDGMEIQQ